MLREILWAIRWLRKSPQFTMAITAILALGIGANTAVFSIVDAVLLRPLPYASPGTLMSIREATAEEPDGHSMPARDYLRWRERTRLFRKTAPYLMDIVTLTGIPEPDQVNALRSSPQLFSLLGAHARLGRPLVDADDAFHSANVVVLSNRLWRRLFHADPRVVGRTLTVSGELCTIVGVMPPEFEFPAPYIDMWTQLRITPASTNWVEVAARLQDGVSAAQAESALAAEARQLEREDPQSKAGLRFQVSPWREMNWRKYEETLVFILVAVGLVLLIASADVGGLLLTRAVQRQKEIAIRASLGAGLWRVVRQLLAESLVLAVLGSAAGVAVAEATLQFLSKQMAALPLALPHLQRAALNGRVLVFNSVLCVLLACVFSLAPVFLASRTDFEAVLRSGQGTGSSRGSARLFAFLIAAEAAFAFLLLAGSGLMIRSLIRLQNADHGFRPEHVLTMRVPIGSTTQPRPTGRFDTKPRQMAYYREMLERLQRIPGIQSIAVVNNPPLTNVNTTHTILGRDGRPLEVPTRTVSPQYFAAMGIPLIAGRAFSEADATGSPLVAIVNQTLARQLFPGHDAVGQTLSDPGSTTPVTVVGVVKDSSQMSYEQSGKAELYQSYQQYIFGVFMSTIVVRTSGEPSSLAAALRKEVWAVDPNQPVVKVETMNDVIADSIWRPRFSAWVFSVLGGLALILTSAGVYAVVAYTTMLRAREVAIRVALGATPAHVAGTVLRGALTPLACGLAAGVVASLLLSKLLTTLLYEISGTDPVTYLGTGALLFVIGILASARPAWRAAAGNPLSGLRMM
jgi:putative ABC transport system permease protein